MWMWGPYQKHGRAYLPAKFEARSCMNVSCSNTAMFISGTVWVANAICLEQRQLPKLGNVQPCLDQFYSFLNSWSPGQPTRTPPEDPRRPLGRVIGVFRGSRTFAWVSYFTDTFWRQRGRPALEEGLRGERRELGRGRQQHLWRAQIPAGLEERA